MPRYYKKYTRSGGRKRRYTKSKSTFSYYKQRSSKQQAYQIAKLDKRIDTVYKNLGGTVKRVEYPSSIGYNWPDTLAVANPINLNNFDLTFKPQGQTGVEEILFRGIYVKVDIKFKYPVVTYSATTSTTPTIWYRFIVIQYRQAGESYTIDDFITHTDSEKGIHDPFNEDSNTKARILKDVKVCIDQTHPERHFTLKFKRHFRIKYAQGVSNQKNTIRLFWMTYNQGANADNISSYGTQCAASMTQRILILHGKNI